MHENLYTLREARADDMAYIDSFAMAEGMDYVRDHHNIIVAVNESDEPVGFLRISLGESGRAYVNPIVVYPAWRGYDVGKTLMEAALAHYGELRLVSRGVSKGFYDRLGFVPCAWEDIEQGVSEDCAHCSWRDECSPCPMKKSLS